MGVRRKRAGRLKSIYGNLVTMQPAFPIPSGTLYARTPGFRLPGAPGNDRGRLAIGSQHKSRRISPFNYAGSKLRQRMLLRYFPLPLPIPPAISPIVVKYYSCKKHFRGVPRDPRYDADSSTRSSSQIRRKLGGTSASLSRRYLVN